MNIVSCAHVFYATYKLTYHVDRYVMWWKGMRGNTRRTILYIGNLLSRDSSKHVTSFPVTKLMATSNGAQTLLFMAIACSEADRKTSLESPLPQRSVRTFVGIDCAKKTCKHVSIQRVGARRRVMILIPIRH